MLPHHFPQLTFWRVQGQRSSAVHQVIHRPKPEHGFPLEGWTLEVIAAWCLIENSNLWTQSYSLVMRFFFFIKLHVGFLQLSLWVQNVQSFGCLKVIISWDEVHCTEMSSVLDLEEEPLNLGASCQVLTWCLDCQRREAGERSGERSWNLCLYLCSVE